MPLLTHNGRTLVHNNKILKSNDMGWMLKIDNWLTGDESYLTKSGTKVLTWTDKINGNVWNDFDGTIDVTHVSGNNYLTFNAGGLYHLTAYQNSKEIYIVHNVQTQRPYNYLTCVYDGIQAAYTGIESYNGGVYYSDNTSGTIYYKRDFTIGNKAIYNSSWTSHGSRNGMLIGVRANKAFPLQGRIYEFITFNTVLTIEERAALNEYMKIKHQDISN